MDENQKVLLNENCELLFKLYPNEARFYFDKGMKIFFFKQIFNIIKKNMNMHFWLLIKL